MNDTTTKQEAAEAAWRALEKALAAAQKTYDKAAATAWAVYRRTLDESGVVL